MTPPVLGILVLFPLVSAAALALVRDEAWVRRAALGAAAVELLLSLWAVVLFDQAQDGMQLVERAPWMPSLNVQYLLGVDGLSILFLPLTALLFGGVMLSSWTSSGSMTRLYYGLLLALEGFTIGVYTALDLILFFLFWELTLVPVFFLITLWGVGAERRYAGAKYTLIMLAGGVPLLFGILMVGLGHAAATGQASPGGLSFDYLVLVSRPLDLPTQVAVFVLLLLGFAVKTPVLPLHTWLPTVAMEGPAGLTALLVGLKLGAYGILRFAIPLAPAAAVRYAWVLGLLGALGVVYGALVALQQYNLRRMLAFASLSHVGLVLVGLSAMNVQGIQGAVMQTLNFSLIAGGLMILAGALHRRLGSTDLTSLGGLWAPFPKLTALFLVLGAASIGLPGTSGFVAEYLILLGAIRTHPGLAVLALSGAVLGAAYFLGFFRHAFMGPLQGAGAQAGRDLQPRETAIAVTMAVLVIVGGLFPGAMLNASARAAQAWADRVAGAR